MLGSLFSWYQYRSPFYRLVPPPFRVDLSTQENLLENTFTRQAKECLLDDPKSHEVHHHRDFYYDGSNLDSFSSVLGFQKVLSLIWTLLTSHSKIGIRIFLTITLSNFAYNFHPVHYSYDIFLIGTKISSDIYPEFTWWDFFHSLKGQYKQTNKG